MKRLIPDTIASRTLLVLIIGLTVSHLLSIAFYVTDRASALMLTGGEHIAERIATISHLAANASRLERETHRRAGGSPEAPCHRRLGERH